MSNNREPWWDDVESDPIHLAAADWLLRLQDENLSLDETLSWKEWMGADKRHAEAFARMEEVSAAVKHLKTLTPPAARVPSSRRLAVAASVVLVVTVAVVVGTVPRTEAVWTTRVGENRTVPLADGSRITLGGNTRVDVALSAEVRSIELSRGEAFFVVAKDPSRPFKVHAGDATVTAVGTQFNVRRDSDRAVVAVTEGRVVVEPVTRIVPLALLREFKPKLRPVHVDAGEQTTAGSAGIEDASKVEDLTATTSWQSGRLAFRLQPLKYVLDDVNRYAKKRIEIEDETIGSLVITGTVAGENVGGWIGSLERAFGLTAVEEEGRIVLRRNPHP